MNLEPAEVIYFNGTVLTMETDFPEVEAVAVANDIIIGAGSLVAMKQWANENTKMVDLQGKTMLPGFIDSHGHFLDTAKQMIPWVDINSKPLGSVECMDDIITLLKERAAITPYGEWVVGWGYDDSKIKEMRHPTKDDLDKISTVHPILVIQISTWASVANSMALKQYYAISDATKDTDVCRLHRDKTGKITGGMEAAISTVISKIPPISTETFMAGIKAASDMYLSKGCTTSQEGWLESMDVMEHCTTALRENLLKTRLVIYPIGEGDVYDQVKDTFPNIPSGQCLDDNNMLVMGAMKLSCDGSIQVYTAYLSESYHVSPEGKEKHYGTENHNQEWLSGRVLELHKAGKQIAGHCNGDQAIEMFLIACEEAQCAFPRDDPRFIFIHCQVVRLDQIKRIAKLGAIISFFGVHPYFWGDRHYNKFLGSERALRIDPTRDAVENNIPFTLHNDTPVTPIDPLLSVWVAVNRQSSTGKDMGKNTQSVSVQEALKGITINAAYQGFEESKKGSIAVGKLADFVILAENPLTVESLHIKDIVISATIVANEIVYGAL